MPMSESLRSIQVFVATYEERSFTAAAKREHATQSGVSQHVRKLEERLGAKLFSRDRGHVVPTPAGEAYYERSVELLRLASAASSVVSRFRGSLTGELVAGLLPTMTRSALAPAPPRPGAAQGSGVVAAGRARAAEHAPQEHRNLSRRQWPPVRAGARARRDARHARLRLPLGLGDDPARHHDGHRHRA